MRAKLNHSGLMNVISTGHTDVTNLVSFAGGDELVKSLTVCIETEMMMMHDMRYAKLYA